MILSRSWCTLECLEESVIFTVPNPLREASSPIAGMTCDNGVLEPALHHLSMIRQLRRTNAGCGLSTLRPAGETPAIFVVWTPHIPTPPGDFPEIDAFGARPDLHCLRISSGPRWKSQEQCLHTKANGHLTTCSGLWSATRLMICRSRSPSKAVPRAESAPPSRARLRQGRPGRRLHPHRCDRRIDRRPGRRGRLVTPCGRAGRAPLP